MKVEISVKQKALRLRKRGLSYNEIRKILLVAKSTLSYWLKHVPLKAKYRKRLYTKQIAILSLGSQSQKERRKREVEKIIDGARQEIVFPLSKDAYRLFGAALYWAEGSKGKMFEITNSDPHFIVFVTRWIHLIFAIPPNQLKARLNIYPQQNEAGIKKFWSNLTGIPVKNFGKTYVKPLSTGYKKNNLYYGTMRIEIPRSVDLHYRVLGWIKAILHDIDPQVMRTRMKWESLRDTARPINLVPSK